MQQETKANNPFKKVAKYFFRGMLLVVPLGLTIYITILTIGWLDGLIGVSIPGLGLLVILASLTIIGYLGSSLLARPIFRFFENIMVQLPLVRIIYTSLRDLVSAFVGDHKKFDYPVLVNMMVDGSIKRLGFITQEEVDKLGAPGFVAVYFPHSYNFSGNLFLLRKDQVTPIDQSSTEVMKFIVSGGVSDIENPKSGLQDILEDHF